MREAHLGIDRHLRPGRRSAATTGRVVEDARTRERVVSDDHGPDVVRAGPPDRRDLTHRPRRGGERQRCRARAGAVEEDTLAADPDVGRPAAPYRAERTEPRGMDLPLGLIPAKDGALAAHGPDDALTITPDRAERLPGRQRRVAEPVTGAFARGRRVDIGILALARRRRCISGRRHRSAIRFRPRLHVLARRTGDDEMNEQSPGAGCAQSNDGAHREPPASPSAPPV